MRPHNLLIPAIFLFSLAPPVSADTVGAIYVNTNIGSVAFTLTGPSNYSGMGLSWSQTNAPAGFYTITYADVPGYATPGPETRELHAGGSITFNGNYFMPGSIGSINVITDLAGAAFTLNGAGNYNGNGTFWSQANAPAGSYTITFAAVAGYPTPPSQTLVLSPGGTITFTGAYGGTAISGTINVATDLATALFTLTGPVTYNGGGMFWSQANAPAGTYTITFAPVPGYPTPPSRTLALSSGTTITFTGSYGTTLGGAIIVSTNLTAATFTLTGPGFYTTGGGAFWSQANCPAGAYTITYGVVAGYPTPPSQTLVLTAGGVIAFSATYGGAPTTGTINVNTNLAGASFLLVGPASYGGNGMSWLQANAPAGTYTITYGTVAGYATPAPQTLTLAAGGVITFNGAYLPVTSTTGTIIVSTNLSAATFTLTGAGDYSGTWTPWVQSNAPAGVYTITYGDVAGYPTPPSQTQVLSPGGTITFSANYGPAPANGTIIVSTNLTIAKFVVTGPGFFAGAGMFWAQPNCPPGSYTIVFTAVPGYPTPPNQTLILGAGTTIAFAGNYGGGPGSGTINVNTNVASASFSLSGAAYYNGSGMWWSQPGAPSGTYIIAFSPVAGYAPPPSQALFLSPGGTITFSCVYTAIAPLDLAVSPRALSFTYDLGQALPSTQKLSVSAAGSAVSLTMYASGGAWLSVSPANATAPSLLTVAVNPSGLPAGVYTGSIQIAAGPYYRAATVPVTLTVREMARLILTPANMSFTSVTKGSRPAAQDLSVSAAVRNVSFTIMGKAGGWLLIGGSGTTPAKLRIAVDPSNLGPGTYTGVITVTSAEALNSPQTVPVTMIVEAVAPLLTNSAVLNAASGDSRLAPCSIASIYGTNLAQSVESAQGTPLPVTLARARINVNGRPAPLFFASPGQINLQIPCDLAAGQAQVEVNNGFASAFTPIQISSTAPGVFLYEAKWAAAHNQDGTAHGDENPAMAGSIVAVYFTGQGLLDGWITAGDAAPMDHLMSPVAESSVTVGALPAKILFIGLSPGSVGLAQVNVRIPELPAGEYALVLTIGDVSSNVAVVCIKTR